MLSFENWSDDLDQSGKDFLFWYGRFVLEFAHVEGWCHVLFRRHSNLKEKIARSIVGGMRFVPDLLPILSKVIEASDLNDGAKADFVICTAQIKNLSAFRHVLVHRGAKQAAGIIDKEMGKLYSSNVLTAKDRDAAEILRFEVSDLKAAAWDCMRIHVRLELLPLDIWGKSGPDSLPKHFSQVIYAPWRYKPVQPEKLNQARRNTHQ